MNEVRNEERTEEKGQEKNTKRLETIKKEDKKFYWKFIALCGIGGIVGGTAGFLMGFLDDYMAARELSFPDGTEKPCHSVPLSYCGSGSSVLGSFGILLP